MAHFAELDNTNTVIRVIVISNEDVNANGGDLSPYAETFVAKLLGGERLPEGGKYDRGDVVFKWNGIDFFVECKARQSLNVTRELAKAIKRVPLILD